MLQKLRDQTQGMFFKVLVGAIILTLAIFGFGAFNLFITTDPAVASVNGDDITQNTLAREAEREQRRMAARLGENYSPDLIDPVRLQNLVLDRLIGRLVLGQAASDLGIGASQRQIDDSIRSNVNFQIDGVFEPDTYRRVLQMMGYTPQSFMQATREMLALEQIQRGISDSSFLTDWELRHNSRLLNQRRDLAYLPFAVETFSAQIQVSDEDLELRYTENERDFMTEESVDVEYVELSVTDLLNDPSIEVTQEDLRQTYDADRASSPVAERRSARHILVNVTDERPAEEAQALLLDLKERIAAGESFADLAQEYSDDPGSASQGGELGNVGEGAFVPEFERVLWSLGEQELSDPVRTEFGYHLIQLDEITIDTYPEFEQLRAEIENRLRREQAEILFQDRLRELDGLAFEQPDSLSGLVDALGLELKTAQAVTRDTGSGIFGNVDLREAVFSDDVLLNGFNSAATEYVENRAVVARATARHESSVMPLEEVADSIRAEIVVERARTEIQAAHAAALARIQAGESVAEVANEYGIVWERAELARRSQPGVPREVLEAAFALPRPPEDGKRVGEATAASGTRYLVTVTRVQDGDVSTMTESEITSLQGILANRTSNLDFEGFYNSLEASASIDRPE